MTDLALRVEGLSKRYHIGKSRGLLERLNVPTFERVRNRVTQRIMALGFADVVELGEVLNANGEVRHRLHVSHQLA